MKDEAGAGGAALEFLGDGRDSAPKIAALVLKTTLFSGFTQEEARRLADYLQLYRSAPGVAIVREGEPGDYMMLLFEGKVDVLKADVQKRQKLIGAVLPGQTFGEMSVVDGEPRFATCVTVEPSLYALLTRDTFAALVSDEPRLGAKLLVQMLEMVDRRLREASEKLVNYLKVS